tara:strand:- start:83 stop:1810 length:1728 start_codon:yes stop_codon:yes gene_type:complete
MAETLLSPGVLTRENDQSLVTQGPVTVGAAILGPAVKGPVNIPTVVTSLSDYTTKFGRQFESNSIAYEYLTSVAVNNYFQQGGETMLVTRIVSGTFAPATALVRNNLQESASFTLETISQGEIMNNSGSIEPSGSLGTGSAENIRWEVSNVNSGSGTFQLIVRAGNDETSTKFPIETYTDLSLDPNSSNYIEEAIGNQVQNFDTDSDGQRFIQVTGSFMNQSRYIRVKSVATPTYDYFNNDGTAKDQYTSSLPLEGSGSEAGSFSGGQGKVYGGGANGDDTLGMFQNISVSSIQGLIPAQYTASLNLLQNKDEYDFEIISLPGVNIQNGSIATDALIDVATQRGDCIAIVDTGNYGSTLNQTTTRASTVDSSYAATYWPWVQVNTVGGFEFVPASTVIPGVYATNDRLGAEWFAPAGFNRGGVGGVIQAERKLSPAMRDTLYSANVNPLATFPGNGTVVFGQKTLQLKATALDRVNVRRLLIELKRTVGNIGKTLLFEQNTAATRNRFLAAVNPYMESIQQRQGLYSYRVVMDETNNTADVIDRNQMIGQIYLQPTKTAEYIILDFNVTPTGVEI